MTTLSLIPNAGHLFVELEGNLWLVDTGAPTSFGVFQNLTIDGKQFRPGASYFGLTSTSLSGFVGVQCCGLLGTDTLGCFDHIFDVAKGVLTVSTSKLSHGGQRIPLDEFMGIPIITARVASTKFRMFFDSGAQISYLQHNSLSSFPTSGIVTDFYPGVGQFQSDTHQVPVSIGCVSLVLRCGSLPGLLGATLKMAAVQGIVGNSVLIDRVVGYFPRRSLLYL